MVMYGVRCGGGGSDAGLCCVVEYGGVIGQWWGGIEKVAEHKIKNVHNSIFVHVIFPL